MNDAEIRAKVDVGDGGGFTRIGNNIKNCDRQAQFLKAKIDDLKIGISQMESMPSEFGKTQITQSKAELEKLENQYNSLKNKQDQTNNGLEKGISKGIKSIKRFGLAIFGLGSIWSLVSRAYTQYISQDDELANKMQAVWVGLGSFLAPAIEKISDVAIRAIKYINVFITALSGVDYLAKAISKSMNKASASTSKANKSLARFDEITNLSENDTADLSWVDAFNDVKLNDNIVNQITTLGLKIKEIWDKYFSPFFNYLKDNWDSIGDDVIGLILIISMVISAATGNWIGFIVAFIAFIVDFIISNWDGIKAIFKLGIDFIWAIIDSLWEMTKGIIELVISIIKTAISIIVGVITIGVDLIKGVFSSILNTVFDIITGVKEIFGGIIDFITGVFTGNWKKAWDGVKEIFKGVFDTLWSIVKLPLNLIIDGINALIGGLNKISFDVPDWIPLIGGNKWGFNIGKIPKLAVGTNYVGQDGLAYLHQGEAVIPKKFNSQEYFSQAGNSDLSSKLDTLIDTLENKDMNAYISKKAIGNASTSYQNQQSRIMGW